MYSMYTVESRFNEPRREIENSSLNNREFVKLNGILNRLCLPMQTLMGLI